MRADSRGPGRWPAVLARASPPGPRLNRAPGRWYGFAAYQVVVPAGWHGSDAPEEFLFVGSEAAKWDVCVIF